MKVTMISMIENMEQPRKKYGKETGANGDPKKIWDRQEDRTDEISWNI